MTLSVSVSPLPSGCECECDGSISYSDWLCVFGDFAQHSADVGQCCWNLEADNDVLNLFAKSVQNPAGHPERTVQNPDFVRSLLAKRLRISASNKCSITSSDVSTVRQDAALAAYVY